MKLINISRTDDGYLIKALISLKIFGIHIASLIREYTTSKDDNHWYDANSHKKVSKRQKLKLDKWLKDHQKFIEKN